ncbi:MAG: DUF1320 family protein [Synechococcaceae cyanobacterium SM1_2_3]|nr:DUF1320 family protein [Synechococcaceae cyanobacterium SM1_2_3]
MPLPITITSVGAITAAQPLITSASAIASAQIALHLAQAEAIVWGYACQRYDIDDIRTPCPPLLESICIDLAAYGVLTKQALLANSLEKSPWPDRYKEALDLLKMVADGELSLVTASGTVISEGGTSYVAAFGHAGTYHPTFTELPSEYIDPDPDKLTDLLTARGG